MRALPIWRSSYYTGTLNLQRRANLHAASGGTLGGNGSFSGALSVQSGGIVAPGASTSNLTVGNSAAIAGSYACELDGTGGDLLIVNGDLDLTGASLSVSTLATPSETSYLIATYTGTRTGTFASVTPGYVPNFARLKVVQVVAP